MGARVWQFTNRFTAYSSYWIELKLDGMILDISPHNLAEPDFSISSQNMLWRGAPLEILHRFTAHSSYAIEMKLGRMILGNSPHNRSESDFPLSREGAVM